MKTITIIKTKKIIFPVIIGLLLSVQSVIVQAAPDSSVVQELSQRIDAMGREINQLRGDNEKLNYEIGRLRQNQKKGFLAIDERFDQRQAAKPQSAQATAKPAPVKPTTVKPTPKPVTVAVKKPAPAQPVAKNPAPAKPVAKVVSKPATNTEKAAYNHAYETLKGNRDGGIREFEAFLKKYPTSSLAENAHYWIGEAHYAKKNYKGAIDSFVVVLNQYKSGRKAPDAAVKLGYSFYALKDWTLARRTFNDVLRYFPGSNAAKLAKTRLDRMIKEGN